ncbi:MAG: hypothetical protein GX677_05765 [Treponema sp.]|nr:hypothetical protein [Treponema sp.]
MEKNEFGNKVADLFSKGAKASKDAFEKAGDAVQDFTDKSITKIENKKIESKINNKYEELGKIVSFELESKDFNSFSEESITKIQEIQKEITSLKSSKE